MPYTKKGPFVDGSVTPPVNAALLNGLETAAATAVGGINYVSAETYGVTASGADVSSQFTALLAGIASNTQIRFPPGLINLGSTNFSIDFSKITLYGDDTILSGSGTMTFFSTVDYSTNEYNWHVVSQGIIYGNTKIFIGSTAHDTQGKFRFADGGLINGSLTFGENAWKIAFNHFHFQNSPIATTPGTGNTGENMIFRDCMIADSSNITLRSGDWHFHGCSIDNVTADIDGCMASFNDVHFENPGNPGAGFRMVKVGPSGVVFISNSQLLLNNPGSTTWNMAPFYVDPANILAGLYIQNLEIPLQPFFTPEVGDTIRVLVAGGGSAHIDGISTYNSTTTPYALTETENLVRNGGSEEGTTAGWAVSGTGSWILDSVYRNRGTSSHKIQAGVGQTCTFAQTFPVRSGKNLWGQLWQSFSPATGGKLNTQINFLDISGAVIQSYGYDQLTGGTVRVRSFLSRLPPGTASAQISFFLQGPTSGVATMNVDDVIMNIA